MTDNNSSTFKVIDNRHRYRAKVRARIKSKRRINSDSDVDLANQLNCLQRAFSQERGEWTRFRNEIIASVNSLLEREREKRSY
jgi:flagellar biosynthesis chaperone FliJ